MHNQDENKIEILILADRGIRISAPRDVLITYLEAYSRGEDPAILKKILDSIISNPESIVEEIPGEEDVVNDKTVQIEP